MSDAEFQLLIDASLRRRLTASETARLHAHLEHDPRAREFWETETALSRVLAGLPDAPLPSNFTARVLQAVDRETAARGQSPRYLRWLLQLRPVHRAAWACGILLFASLSYHQFHSVSRARMAASLASVTSGVESAAVVAQLPPAELWQDFDSISRLPEPRTGRAVAADEELLAALK
jgi:anti-sigma factor RsiW